MIDSRYPGLSTAIVDSLLWRVGAAVLGAFANAWPASRTAAAIAATTQLRGLFSVALIAAVSCAVALAMQLAIPSYVRSGLPLMWPVAAIVLLSFLSVWAKAFERAWPDSRVARWSTTSRSTR